MRFIWTDTVREVEVDFGSYFVGMVEDNVRPDKVVITEQEMADYVDKKSEEYNKQEAGWWKERYISQIVIPTLAIGGSMEIVSSCNIRI